MKWTSPRAEQRGCGSTEVFGTNGSHFAPRDAACTTGECLFAGSLEKVKNRVKDSRNFGGKFLYFDGYMFFFSNEVTSFFWYPATLPRGGLEMVSASGYGGNESWVPMGTYGYTHAI